MLSRVIRSRVLILSTRCLSSALPSSSEPALVVDHEASEEALPYSNNRMFKHVRGQQIAVPSMSGKLNDEVEPIEMSAEDKDLINRDHFFGVKSNNTPTQMLPELAIGRLKEMIDRNQRFYGEFFMTNVLLPLENKETGIVNMLKVAPDQYLPFLIRCCGLVMADVDETSRIVILERFITAANDNGLLLSLNSFNALLETWLENHCEFSVDDVLHKVEVDLKLDPDLTFFNNLLWRLAYQKDHERLKSMLLEMNKRGILPDFNSQMPLIYCSAACGFDAHCTSLIERVVAKYGKDKESECLSYQIRGVANSNNIGKLRKLLRNAIVNANNVRRDRAMNSAKPENQRLVLNISTDALFDVIWSLAKYSHGDYGRQYTGLIEQLLEHADRQAGFFKRLLRESWRHMVHQYYYSGSTLLMDTARVRSMLETQRKNSYLQHMIPRFTNLMVRNNVEEAVIRDIANRLLVQFGPSVRFYDSLAFSILNFKGYRHDERFSMFAKFVDKIDPDRSRSHLLIPILVHCQSLNDRQQIFYQCAKAGYQDLTSMDERMMVKLFFQPMLESLVSKRMAEHDMLSRMSAVMASFGMPPTTTFELLFRWASQITLWNSPYNLAVTKQSLKSWLKAEQDRIYAKQKAEKVEKDSKFTGEVFLHYLKTGDIDKMHSFLIERGDFPPEIDLNSVINPLIELYIRNATWGANKKLLNMLASVENSACASVCDSAPLPLPDYSPVKNYHLLKFLTRYFLEKKDVAPLMGLLFELKTMFPHAVVTNNTFIHTMKMYETMFRTILRSRSLNVVKIDDIVDLVTQLLKLDIISLHSYEALTLSVVEKVLNSFKWDVAVDTWLKFQSSLYCPNGVFALLNRTVGVDDKAKVQYLVHRAKNFISPSRVNAYLAGAYVMNNRLEEAEDVLKNASSVSNGDLLDVLRLTHVLSKRSHVLEYLTICLKHSNLRNDRDDCDSVINYCLWLFGCRNQSEMALDFYNLMKDNELPFTLQQMKKLESLCSVTREALKNYLVDDATRLFKLPLKADENSFLVKFDDFEEDLRIARSAEVAVEQSHASVIEGDDDAVDAEVRADVPQVFATFLTTARTKDDLEEVSAMFKELAAVYPQCDSLDSAALMYLSKTCELEGVDKVMSTGKEIREMFAIHQERKPRHLQILEDRIAADLFTHALAAEGATFNSVSRLCDHLVDMHFLRDRNVFLETSVRKLVKEVPFTDIFSQWSSHCVSEHTVAGGAAIFEHVLSDHSVAKKVRQKRIRNVLGVFEQVQSPSHGMAQLITSMVATNNVDDARALWKKLSIDCRNFVKPIQHLVQNEELASVNAIHIDQMTRLVEECVIPEIRKNGKPRSEGEKENAEGDMASSRANISFLLDQWKPRKRNYVKHTIPKHVVKPVAFERLLWAVQGAWVQVADHANDTSHLKSMQTFLQRNNFAVRETLLPRIAEICERLGEKSPFSEGSESDNH